MKTFLTAVCLLILIFPRTNLLSQVPSDRNALLTGQEKSLAAYADASGFPDPKQVLDLSSTLGLNDSQRKSVQTIYSEMITRAKELGQRIVGIEEEMSSAFKAGLVNEKSITDDSEQIGKLRGRLRAVYLTAHIKTKRVLTAAQIDLYQKLKKADDKHQ